MNKLMTIGMAAAMVAGIAGAQDDVVMVGQPSMENTVEVQATVETALVSSHVWRGQVLNNDFAIQPQFTIAKSGVSLNVWANYDLGKNYLGVESDFSEIDLSLAYTLPLDLNDVSFDLGVISYQYPANGAGAGKFGVNKNSTVELFAAANLLTFKDYAIPSVTAFGDVKEAKGIYVLFDIVAPYQVSDYLFLEAGASTGWGNTSYNDYYWGIPGVGGVNQDKGFNDYNFYFNAGYDIYENLMVSLNLTYTGVYGGSIKNMADTLYESSEKVWGGVNLAYDF